MCIMKLTTLFLAAELLDLVSDLVPDTISTKHKVSVANYTGLPVNKLKLSIETTDEHALPSPNDVPQSVEEMPDVESRDVRVRHVVGRDKGHDMLGVYAFHFGGGVEKGRVL
jgi:hypothetical protein